MNVVRHVGMPTASHAIFSVLLAVFSFPGAVKGEGMPDIQTLVDAAAAHGQSFVEIPPGIYRIAETLHFEDLKHFEIRAAGVTLVKTTRGEALRILRCSNLKVSGMTFDYAPLPFTQGTITEISPDATFLDFQIHTGYPPVTPEMSAISPRHYFDARTRLWKDDCNYYSCPKLEILETGKVRAKFDRPQTGVKPGDFIALDRRSLEKAACVSIRSCTGRIEFEDVAIHASGGLTFVGRYCEEAVVFRGVKIERGPRPQGATEDRLLSSDADGVNFAYCRKGPVLENCDFSFMGDDSLNVHGALFPVMRVLSPTRILISRGDGPDELEGVFRVGDDMEILAATTFEKIGGVPCASIKKMSSDQGISGSEVARYFPEFKNSKKPAAVFQIDFQQPVDFLKPGQWVEFPGLNCPYFAVRNSTFHDHRARGLRIMGSHGVVEGNRFERIGSAAIQIGPEYQYWRESGWVRDVQIRNNTFKDIGFGGDFKGGWCYTPGVISVCARTDSQKPPFPRGNEDVVIDDNTIDGCPASGIHAYGVNRLIIRNNTIRNTNTGDTSHTGEDFQLSARHAIELEGVSNPVIDHNRLPE
ncbi:MAG: right-handed parallel beta-helix repeat-containing protein [Terrimicrobiaceae bacterium]